MSRAAIPSPLERDVQRAVLDYLNCIWDVSVWRQNSGAVVSEYKGRKRLTRFGKAGDPDLTGIGPHGVRIDIEVKRQGKRPTLAQDARLIELSTMGGIAFWCDSVASCAEKLAAEFERRGWTGYNLKLC